MKQRLGAVLCLLFGAVLIWGGVSAGSLAAGSVAATCVPASGGGVANHCPTGTITFTETTSGPGSSPSQWTITVTSSCTDPGTGLATHQTLHVPNNGSLSTSALYVYTDNTASTTCSYRYTETAAPRFTKTFSPASPAAISFNSSQTGSNLPVTVRNVSSGSSSSGASSTPPSSPPTTPPTTAPVSSSTPNSSSAGPSSTSRTSPSSGNAPTVIARTGPATRVGSSIAAGIALCVLGGGLLIIARRPRRARQH